MGIFTDIELILDVVLSVVAIVSGTLGFILYLEFSGGKAAYHLTELLRTPEAIEDFKLIAAAALISSPFFVIYTAGGYYGWESTGIWSTVGGIVFIGIVAWIFVRWIRSLI